MRFSEICKEKVMSAAWVRFLSLLFGVLVSLLVFLDLSGTDGTSPITLINNFMAKSWMVSPNTTEQNTTTHNPVTLRDQIQYLYTNGVPVRPTRTFPTCDKFLTQIKDPSSRFHLLAMYDPGNCAEIPDYRERRFENLSVENERKELLAGPRLVELSNLCSKVNGTVGDPNWRLCYGMPEEFHYSKWTHQRYSYGKEHVTAKHKLGSHCFHKRVALFFHLPNLNHQGGPRKVLNNLLSGFRLIGKPYVVNACRLGLFDIIFSPDPHHGFFMYYITEEDIASKFYIGPTVEHGQFKADRITKAVRSKSHIVGASRRALDSQQYFPKIPLDKNNSVVIPTGVDEVIFSPSNRTRTKAFVYVKGNCDKATLNQIKLLIKLPISQIYYGGYTEDQFRTTLREAKYGVVCDSAETQGIAIEEMMAMDVPLYITDSQAVPYFSDQVGAIMPTNKSLLASSFQKFVSNVQQGVYKPRKWLVENLGLAESAIYTMKVFCGIKNEWNPWMTGAAGGNQKR